MSLKSTLLKSVQMFGYLSREEAHTIGKRHNPEGKYYCESNTERRMRELCEDETNGVEAVYHTDGWIVGYRKIVENRGNSGQIKANLKAVEYVQDNAGQVVFV